ncbi:MAG TPA: UbiA family prenyltransferase [Caldilineaceae bacterium]|nr:UbiA family prenyltransferase [Caldilineaceae bacterium]
MIGPGSATLRPADSLARSYAWLRLVRLSNSLPASLLILLGPHLLSIHPIPAATWRAAAAIWCITAFGYVTNDLADVHEDALNKPDRPLPSGRVAVAHAQRLALMLAGGGLLMAATISAPALAVAALVLGLLQLYSRRLKATPGAGNLLIGLLAGAALVAGGVSAAGPDPARLWPLFPPALTLATFITAREVLKTLEDVSGDHAAGKSTLAVRYGPRVAHRVFVALALLTTCAALLPLLMLDYSWRYSWLMGLGVIAPLLGAAVDLAGEAATPRARRWLALLKASYGAGLLALLLA